MFSFDFAKTARKLSNENRPAAGTKQKTFAQDINYIILNVNFIIIPNTFLSKCLFLDSLKRRELSVTLKRLLTELTAEIFHEDVINYLFWSQSYWIVYIFHKFTQRKR